VDYHETEANPALGGFARLSRAVKDIRAAKAAAGEPVLLLSGGDYLGGSPFAWLTLENGKEQFIGLCLNGNRADIN